LQEIFPANVASTLLIELIIMLAALLVLLAA
jgi:hypothetical protein